MSTHIEGSLVGTGMKIGIVSCRWNDFMGERMLEGAIGTGAGDGARRGPDARHDAARVGLRGRRHGVRVVDRLG